MFSFVVVHFQGTVPHDIFLRGIASLQNQTFKSFEILCYHDGPLLEPRLAMPVPVRATPQRFNDFGHSLRDLGIRRMKLLGSPRRMPSMTGYGLEVTGFIAAGV